MSAKRPPSEPFSPRIAQMWPLYRDIGAFVLGSFMLIWQTVFEENAQAILVLTGFGALGIAGSGVAQRILAQRFLEEKK